MLYCNAIKCLKNDINLMNIKKDLFYFFQLIQKLREKHQQYSSYLESDLESENEIEYIDVETKKQIPSKKDYQQQSMRKKINYFPNHSNFDDTG